MSKRFFLKFILLFLISSCGTFTDFNPNQSLDKRAPASHEQVQLLSIKHPESDATFLIPQIKGDTPKEAIQKYTRSITDDPEYEPIIEKALRKGVNFLLSWRK